MISELTGERRQHGTEASDESVFVPGTWIVSVSKSTSAQVSRRASLIRSAAQKQLAATGRKLSVIVQDSLDLSTLR